MKVIYKWEDSFICFVCPKCGSELVGDSQGGKEECDCGIKYQFCSYLLIDGTKVTEYEQKRTGMIEKIRAFLDVHPIAMVNYDELEKQSLTSLENFHDQLQEDLKPE